MTFGPPLYPGFKGCNLTASPTSMWENYAIMTAVEAIVLALMVISAFRSYRFSNGSELWRVIHRDGILFYVYLLGFTLANLVAIIIFPVDTKGMLSSQHVILYAVLTCRIVLGIRQVSNKRSQTELHSGFHDLPLVFIAHPTIEDPIIVPAADRTST